MSLNVNEPLPRVSVERVLKNNGIAAWTEHARVFVTIPRKLLDIPIHATTYTLDRIHHRLHLEDEFKTYVVNVETEQTEEEIPEDEVLIGDMTVSSYGDSHRAGWNHIIVEMTNAAFAFPAITNRKVSDYTLMRLEGHLRASGYKLNNNRNWKGGWRTSVERVEEDENGNRLEDDSGIYHSIKARRGKEK